MKFIKTFFRSYLTINIFFTLFLINNAFAFNELINLRAGNHNEFFRVVIETSKKPEIKLLLKENPYSFEIELEESLWRVGNLPRQGSFSPNIPAKYRFSNNKYERSIINIQTEKPFSIDKIFWLPPSNGGNRLVIDFWHSSKSSFEINKLALNNMSLKSLEKIINETPQVVEKDIKLLKPQPSISKLDNLRNNDSNNVEKTKFIIVIDPGHGGKDPGAIGYSGIKEKDINLIASRLLQKKINTFKNIEAYLTRNNDKYINLHDRYKIARIYKADLFISIHSDSVKNKNVRGYSIFTLDENKASDPLAAELAKSENESEFVAGIDFKNEIQSTQVHLQSSYQRRSLNNSVTLANLILKKLSVLNTTSRGRRYAGFAVLKAPAIPSVLIEMGFLSNKVDERNLKDENYLNKLTSLISEALYEYKKLKS